MAGPVAGAFALAVLMLASACQSGGQPREQVLQSDLTGYCPRVQLREGTAYFTTYAKGGQDDPAKIVHQASISDVTRSCTRAGGMLTMKVAVAGRVVSGPAGGPGTVTMPIRVAVCGRAESPGLFETLRAIGKIRVTRRIGNALALLEV